MAGRDSGTRVPSQPTSRKKPTKRMATSRTAARPSVKRHSASAGAKGRGGSLASAFFDLPVKLRVAILVVCALLVVGALDFATNWGRVYPGVKVGSVDVSGMTQAEAKAAIDDAYNPVLASGNVVVFASDEAKSHAATDAERAEARSTAEQRSVEEGRASKESWETNADDLGASVASGDIAARALRVGREDGGLGARIGALFGGRALDPELSFGDGLESLASEIDLTIGSSRVDWGVSVSGGTASVTEGHDGNLIDRDEFSGELTSALLASGEGDRSCVAYARYTPVRIDEAEASATCGRVNAAIANGACFTCGNDSWTAYPGDVGEWVATDVACQGGAWSLVPSIDAAKAKSAILSSFSGSIGSDANVAFSVSGDDVVVKTSGTAEVPDAAAAAASLNDALFGEGAQPAAETPRIDVDLMALPSELSFDDALDLGVIGRISRYTTEYLDGAGTENRRHNIHLAADFLNNSVAAANGGTWSFNDVAGQCDSERGFLGAGAIVDNSYQDAVGGGICQVATTVFNAVYEAGYPVVSRSNHSLYIASYPKGRDAAVSWPDLDFVWKNDAASDVLMRTSYTDTSITVTLYGVDPGYKVSTRTGDWEQGEPHSTKVERDSALPAGTSYVKTAGADGATIDVFRTVKDKSGNVLREDDFHSVYAPITEVVVAAPDADVQSDSSGTSSRAASS